MQLEQILEIIKNGEGLKVEFKSAGDTVPSSFYETVVSFSNTDGGTILLGVEDDASISGISGNASTKLKKDIITALNSPECINPPIYIQPYSIRHDEKEVLVIQIPASSQVHEHKTRIYIREFESDIDITDNQLKVGELYLRKRDFFSESTIYSHLSISDLDSNLFAKARQLIRNYKSDHPWLMVSDEQMLKDSVLWRKDFKTGDEGLTLAAALIFGKDSTIQSILPAYKVEAMVRIVNKDRWDDRINPPLRTNLIDTYILLKEFVNKHLPEKFYVEGDQRVDLRDKIFREVIGNVIVHREYTSALSTEMIINENAVIFTNPNKALFHGIIDPSGFNPYPKNPNIRKFFTAFGWTDEIGSGIRNTSKYLPVYANGAKPVFTENDVFRTEIPLNLVTLGIYSRQFLNWLNLPETIFEHINQGFQKIALPSFLPVNQWTEVLLHLVPSWHKKGTQLFGSKWPENQIHTKEQIILVPSWDQQGTQLLSKKAWYIIVILSLTSGPIKLNEILKLLEYKNEKSFRDNYIRPIRDQGLIEFTNPEKPTDPENRYQITEAGKAFLGGK